MFSIVRNSSVKFAVRSFSSAPVRNNAIQDLYIKELKAFKPTPISAADAESAVRAWKTPVAPQIPALEVDAATQLGDYEAAEVEVVSATSEAEAAAQEWFVLQEPEDNHH